MISGILTFLGNLFGFLDKRQEAKNATDIKANAGAADRSDAEQRITEEIDKQDVDAIRKELAE